jgi:hypothetical protein
MLTVNIIATLKTNYCNKDEQQLAFYQFARLPEVLRPVKPEPV